MKTISSKILHKNPWWEYKHDEYELPSGQVGNYYYAETPGVSIVIPRLANGLFGLVKQFRYLAQRESWEFPGGGIKSGQTPEVAARAELQEEAGLAVKSMQLLGEVEPANGFIKDHTYLWLAEVETAAEGQKPDESEAFSDFKVVTAKQFEGLIAAGEIWDGQTLAAWCLAKAKGLV